MNPDAEYSQYAEHNGRYLEDSATQGILPIRRIASRRIGRLPRQAGRTDVRVNSAVPCVQTFPAMA